MSHGEGEEESDIFAIREVSFQPEGDSEWKETSYTLNTDSLDWVRINTWGWIVVLYTSSFDW